VAALPNICSIIQLWQHYLTVAALSITDNSILQGSTKNYPTLAVLSNASHLPKTESMIHLRQHYSRLTALSTCNIIKQMQHYQTDAVSSNTIDIDTSLTALSDIGSILCFRKIIYYRTLY
jgi:hypothetical protein